MKIEESNKLIAEFMGMSCIKDTCEPVDNYEWMPRFEHSNWCFKDAPPFNIRLDWLMPVVEKIMSLEYDNGEDHAYLRTFGMLSNSKKPLVRFNRCAVWEGETLLKATYAAVIDFININK